MARPSTLLWYALPTPASADWKIEPGCNVRQAPCCGTVSQPCPLPQPKVSSSCTTARRRLLQAGLVKVDPGCNVRQAQAASFALRGCGRD